MVSDAFGWHDENKTWSIEHDLEKGPNHLERSGPLPLCFEDIFSNANAEYERQPSGPDCYIDVPLKIFTAITNFTFDTEIEGLDECPFERLPLIDT